MKLKCTIVVLLLTAAVACCRGAVIEHIKGPGRMDALPGEFPYYAAIFEKATNKLICSGVLLRSKVVLTHAVYVSHPPYQPDELKVVLGIHDRTEDEDTRQEISVTQIVTHPSFELYSFGAGYVALLQLEDEPELGKNIWVQPLGVSNIATSDEELDIMGNSESCIVPGFGLIVKTDDMKRYPKILQKYVPKIKKQRACQHFMGKHFYKRPHEMCSMNTDMTTTCNGDEGAPMLCDMTGNMKLYGIPSFQTTNCNFGLTFFVRISSYYNWIKQVAQRLQNSD